MKVSIATLAAIALLSGLASARLRQHVKRTPIVDVVDGADKNACGNGAIAKHGEIKTNYDVVPLNDHSLSKAKGVNYNAGIPSTTPTQPDKGKEKAPTHQRKSTNVPAGGLLAANIFRPDFILGVAVRSEQLDGRFDECILPHANTIVPEYEFKTGAIHPEPKQYNFGPMDKIAAYAKKHNLNLRLHNLFWTQGNPQWLNDLRGNKVALKAAMTEHISTVMGRYGSEAIQVDVINEFMDYAGTGQPINDLFYSTLGNEYLEFAFKITETYKHGGAVLYLNDNDIEGMNYKVPGKRAGLIKIMKGAVGNKIPIGGIGMECHFVAGKVPKDLGESIQGFIDLGLKVMITELDIESSGDIQQQADDYAFVYETCINKMGCVGVMRWDMDEDVSWEAGTKAELYGSNCASKGLDEGVKQVLRTGKRH